MYAITHTYMFLCTFECSGELASFIISFINMVNLKQPWWSLGDSNIGRENASSSSSLLLLLSSNFQQGICKCNILCSYNTKILATHLTWERPIIIEIIICDEEMSVVEVK